MSVYDDEPEEFDGEDEEDEPFAAPAPGHDDEDDLEIPGVGGDDWEAADREDW